MLKFLCKLVNLTTSYKRKHKGMFFLNSVYNNNLWINQAISDADGMEESPQKVFDGLFS